MVGEPNLLIGFFLEMEKTNVQQICCNILYSISILLTFSDTIITVSLQDLSRYSICIIFRRVREDHHNILCIYAIYKTLNPE